ncbi:MAG: hypothetical protein ACOYMA_20055 [Bacteroidia bacterium]
MFDKITIRVKLSNEECLWLSHLHLLHVWTNTDCTQVEYRSSEYSKISGIEITIKRNFLTLKTSLHKYWNYKNYDKLRNDNLFTVSEAKSAFEMLLYENRLQSSKVRITQFEIGLNLNVSYDPLTFIEQVKHLPTSYNKLMFIDANYHINRQRTTEKYKDIRKYFKIYDKGWEMMEKKRKPTNQRDYKTNTLRIETCFRRHNDRGDKFFTDSNIDKLVTRFYSEWRNLFFTRDVIGRKGTRKSEIERATIFINEGKDSFLSATISDFVNKKITEQQFRTIREFIRDFNKYQGKFCVKISRQEIEYKELLYKVFDVARK